jgi:hypothetical protein
MLSSALSLEPSTILLPSLRLTSIACLRKPFLLLPDLMGKLERISLIGHTREARDGTQEICTVLKSIQPLNPEPRNDITALQLQQAAHGYL